MSTRVMSDCWDLQMQSAYKSVLISLADQANDEGLCWPSIQNIAKRTCLSERGVQKALAWLESVDAIRRVFRGGRSTHYHLTPRAYTPASGSPRTRCTPSIIHPNPAPDAPPPPHRVHLTPASHAPRTVIEPSVEPSKEPSVPARAAKQPPQTSETWAAYAKAFAARYGTQPVRNATVNGQMANFVKRIGLVESPDVAAYYVAHNSSFYIGRGHAVGNMLADAEKLRTEWATGNSITQTKARQMDKTASNPFLQILSEMKNEQS